jgi:ketosteroid isomerase-like protein
VDIKTGLLEATERVTGPPEKLMELENELAVRALRALGVDPTAQQLASVLATRGNETLEAYKMFSETFGDEAKPPPDEPPAAQPPAPAPRSPESGPRAWWSFPASAWAGEDDPDAAAIRDLLARYSAALSARNVDQVAAVQPGLTEEGRQRLAGYFQNAPDLQVRISDVDVLREGNEAIVSYSREDVFTDARSGRRMRLDTHPSARLRRGPDGAWTIVTPGGPV